ncbi:MAG: hypothetical protein PHX83_14785 [Acidobacteriia bacterium]|nr:hypothetical protein [Terriglobia bacterium]
MWSPVSSRRKVIRIAATWILGLSLFSWPAARLLQAASQQQPPTTPPPQPTETKKPKRAPQAKTQIEYDAYQAIDAEKDPSKKMALVDKFAVDFPDSELRVPAFALALESAQQISNYEKTIDYARKIVQLQPDHVLSLLILASWLPERTTENDPQRDAKLKEAADAAGQLIKLVPTLDKPDNATADQWATQ